MFAGVVDIFHPACRGRVPRLVLFQPLFSVSQSRFEGLEFLGL